MSSLPNLDFASQVPLFYIRRRLTWGSYQLQLSLQFESPQPLMYHKQPSSFNIFHREDVDKK